MAQAVDDGADARGLVVVGCCRGGSRSGCGLAAAVLCGLGVRAAGRAREVLDQTPGIDINGPAEGGDAAVGMGK